MIAIVATAMGSSEIIYRVVRGIFVMVVNDTPAWCAINDFVERDLLTAVEAAVGTKSVCSEEHRTVRRAAVLIHRYCVL